MRLLLGRSGETAFWNMSIPYGWAKRPMIHRMHQLQPHIPIAIIYGSRSSVDSSSGAAIRELKPGRRLEMVVRWFGCGGGWGALVNAAAAKSVLVCILLLPLSKRPCLSLQTIRGAGHYVYADQPDDFNRRVLLACEDVD